MDDIAQHAGVSRATVSYVLNKRNPANGTIREETRQRVLSSASALDYRTNELAKSVVTGKNRVLSVLMSPYVGENVLQILTGAIEATEQRGYLLKILHLSDDPVREDVISRCQGWRIAGAICFGLSTEAYNYLHPEFRRIGMPVGLINDAPEERPWGVWVRSDDAQGIRLAVSHLTGLGHRRIAFLGGRPSPLSEWREKWFYEAIGEAGLSAPKHRVLQSSWGDVDVIAKAAAKLLNDSSDRPTAIVCSGDMIAATVIRVARSLGIRCPEDLSVTGYANSELSRAIDPPLTTLDQSFREMGRVATLKVIDFAEGIDTYDRDDLIWRFLTPTRLVERESTAQPRRE
jgi:LacI family transcriptional regulator